MTPIIYAVAAGIALAGTLLLFEPAAPPVAAQDGRSEAIAPVGILQGGPSLSAAQIDAILASYGSPATGQGGNFYNLGVEWGVDPAYALAFFVMESSAGTDPRWDGHKPDGTTTHDIGNIACAGYPTCYGRWRDYDSWRTGVEDWYRLISVEYIDGRGHQTVDDVIPVYAPAFENDVDGYTNTVSALVGKWRSEYGREATQAVFLPSAFVSNPIAISSDSSIDPCGVNVLSALDNGTLRYVPIAPGETWSFNVAWGALNEAHPVYSCAGVYGGNICNLAARYAQVARAIGLTPVFQDHGVGDLGGGAENSVAIWGGDGTPGNHGVNLDLLITNTHPTPVTFRAIVDGGAVVIEGEY